MRILYGMAGEGNGHATRSRVAIEHLRRRGHDVVIAAPGDSYRVLGSVFPDVLETENLTMKYSDGAVDWPATVVGNLARIGTAYSRNTGVAERLDALYAPEAVVTDLDRFSWQYAADRDLPVVSLDNHIGIARAEAPIPVARMEAAGIQFVTSFVDALIPRCRRYLATSFAPLRPRAGYEADTRVLPPVLRAAVLDIAARPPAVTTGSVLVYQTSRSDVTRLLETLRALSTTRFVVYGLRRDEQLGNVRLAPFSEEGFLRDLAAAPAVLSNGGFTLLSEAVALGKPVLSVPLQGHPEQSYNASLLEQMGFGMRAERHDASTLSSFLRRAPGFAATLASEPRHDFNAALYAELDIIFPA